MKLKEELADTYAERIFMTLDHMDEFSQGDVERAYIAGFEAAIMIAANSGRLAQLEDRNVHVAITEKGEK